MSDQTTHYYDVEVEWIREREGELRSTSLPKLPVSSPPEFKGPGGIWTPEHLFVASINSCFMLTFLAIAEASKLEFISFNSNAHGKLEKVGGYQFTEIILRPKLVIRSRSDLERAGRILEKAEKNCLISNSVKTVVKLEPEFGYGE